MRTIHASIAALSAAAALIAAAPAQAQSEPPTATTGGVAGISPTSANLNGSSNPRGNPTEVFMRYGVTNLGLSSPPQAIGSGTRPVPVRVSISDLRPNTKYSYRLVARSPRGQTAGSIRSFKTPPAPPSVTLAAAPLVVTIGQSVVLSGTVGGTGAPGSQVQPQFQPFPFSAPFAPAGNALVAGADGAYNFQTSPPVTTDYRTVATVNGKTAVSPVVRVGVAPKVSLRIRRLSKRRVRFRGNVEPGGDAVVRLIRIGKGGERKTLKKTVTRGGELKSFKFKKRKVRRKADFVVQVTPTNGAFVPGESRVRTVKPKKR